MNLPTLQERNDRYIRRVFRLCGGNVTKTAQALGIGRATCYREVARLGIFQPMTPEQLKANRVRYAENARQHRQLRKYRQETEVVTLTTPIKPFWLP